MATLTIDENLVFRILECGPTACPIEHAAVTVTIAGHGGLFQWVFYTEKLYRPLRPETLSPGVSLTRHFDSLATDRARNDVVRANGSTLIQGTDVMISL